MPIERAVCMIEIIFISAVVLVGVVGLLLLPKLLPDHDRLLGRVKVVLLLLYILVILYETLLSRSITGYASYKLSLFWSYRRALSLYQGSDGWRLLITDSALLKQIILNILLYIPFGYLLPFARPRLAKPKRASSRFSVIRVLGKFPWTIVLIGTLFSVGIEIAQLFFRLGLFELDDIFNNTVGCLLGVILYQLLLRPGSKKTDPA